VSSGEPARELAELLADLPEALLDQVVAHSSWVDERADSYERLAFLGDSVLGLAIAEHLYAGFPRYGAGGLTRVHGQAVSGKACAQVGFAIGLDELLLQREPPASEGRHAATDLLGSERVMASLCEAAIGACYLEHGYEQVSRAIVAAFAPQIAGAVARPIDFKSALQEDLAREGLRVEYVVTETHGPPHSRTFEVDARVAGETIGAGTGTSKKSAEQGAAEEAMAARRKIAG
jgi:ribonuclease-3